MLKSRRLTFRQDGFKPVHAWVSYLFDCVDSVDRAPSCLLVGKLTLDKVSNGIVWLDEIQQFYRERSAIEKEYSAKLYALAKKYFDKKAKKSANLSVGDTPSLTPGSLERFSSELLSSGFAMLTGECSASLTTWTTQLSTLESRAAEHDRFSAEIISHVAEPLKNVAAKYEEIRKSHADFAAKLEKERDLSFNELKKIKGRYDGTCQEVENRRKKIESSFDYGKQKAQTAYQQQLADMRNVKVMDRSNNRGIEIDPARIHISLASMSRINRRGNTTMSMYLTC